MPGRAVSVCPGPRGGGRGGSDTGGSGLAVMNARHAGERLNEARQDEV